MPVAVAGVIVAVNVTDWPDVDGFRLEVTTIDGFVLTFRESGAETEEV